MMAGSMIAHLQRLHGTYPEINWYRMLLRQYKHLPQVYEVSFHREISKFQSPFPGCPGSSRLRIGLCNNFNRMHWKDSIQIPEDNTDPNPHCERCGLQIPLWQLNNHHYNMDQCRLVRDCWRQSETLQQCFESI